MLNRIFGKLQEFPHLPKTFRKCPGISFENGADEMKKSSAPFLNFITMIFSC
jgi:hypothetical protein